MFFFCLLILAMLITFGPLDELADERSFWAHMLEHSFQSWIIPPLLLLSVPDWMFRPILMSRPIRPLARFFTNPVVAFVTFTVIYVFAHDPPIFNLMMTNEGVHIAVHMLFMVAGTILFWPLLSPMAEFPRLSYPAQILYLFLLMVPMTAVAAPITLAESVTYPWYAVAPHPFGIEPDAGSGHRRNPDVGRRQLLPDADHYAHLLPLGARRGNRSTGVKPAPRARIATAPSDTQRPRLTIGRLRPLFCHGFLAQLVLQNSLGLFQFSFAGRA